MNLLHRWMGRMTVAHILIHMSGYFWRHVRTGKIKSNWGQRYYRAGIFVSPPSPSNQCELTVV